MRRRCRLDGAPTALISLSPSRACPGFVKGATLLSAGVAEYNACVATTVVVRRARALSAMSAWASLGRPESRCFSQG